MKYIKRILFVAGILFLSMFFGTVGSAASSRLLLNTKTSNIASGSEFNVTLRIDTTTAISGLSTKLSYNPSQLSYLSNSDYATSFPVLWAHTPDPGNITMVRSTGGASLTGNLVVITYSFKVIAASGQFTLSVTGTANAGGVELTLSSGTLGLNISSTSVPANASTPAATNKPTSAPSLATSKTTDVAKPDSVDIGADTISDRETKPASVVSNTLGKITGVGGGNKLVLAGIVVAVLLFAGGVWFGLRARRRAQNASHFPDLHATIFTETSGAPNAGESPRTVPEQQAPQPSLSFAASNQPTPSVVDPVVIQPQVVQPTATPPNAAPHSPVMPEGGVIRPDETPKLG